MALQRELRDRFDETMVLSVWGTQGPTIVHVEEAHWRDPAYSPNCERVDFAAFLPRHFRSRSSGRH